MAQQLPQYETLALTREGRRLTITMNMPDTMNAVTALMHEELAEVFTVAAMDEGSDVIVLTGAGRAFSAGGNLDHLANNAANPHLFEKDLQQAKRILGAILDLEKPLICRMNGHAVGLGATLALFCDIVYASEKAKIGDPHVALGLVAGDGGAIIWPQRIGLTLAKEFLLTGELLGAQRAADIGLINKCLPAEELDAAVDELCGKLLNGAQNAIRWTKVLTNMELKRLAGSVLEAGIAYEAVSVRTPDHQEGVKALQEKRAPVFPSSRPQRKGE